MGAKVRTVKDLIVWRKAYRLTLDIYKATGDFPHHEQYGLISQMRRAAVSVVSNIAEGYSRKGRNEYVNFLSIAYASLSELETQLLLSKDLKYLEEKTFEALLNLKDEAGAMLFRMQQKLREQGTKKSDPGTLTPEPCSLTPERNADTFCGKVVSQNKGDCDA